MNIVLLSNHWYLSPRKAGFHHLADSWHAQGHTVTFATVGFSLISYARRDFRTRYNGIWQARNVMQNIRPGLDSFVHFTLLHPHTTLCAALDDQLAGFMAKYDRYPLGPLRDRISQADVIVYESNAALYLVQLCRTLAPQARHIYRVSDDICTMRSTPNCMVALEQKIAPAFSLISVPCTALAQKFSGLPTVRVQTHGLTKEIFDACTVSPFATDTVNAVFSGLGFYDAQAVHSMAASQPQVDFHILGISRPQQEPPANVKYYGELPFSQTIPYIKFSHCGLYTLRQSSRPMQAYTDSLKIMQYRYCGLPIIAPSFLDLHREGIFYYTPANAESCADALKMALENGCHAEYAQEVHSWDEVSRSILNAT